MENLADPLVAALQMRLHIQNGASLRVALKEYLLKNDNTFAQSLRMWVQDLDIQLNISSFKSRSFLQVQLASIIARGLEGQSIEDSLDEVIEEMILVSREDIDHHLQTLPQKMLIPLLLFQFPGFLLILLGPIFYQLTHHLSGIS